MNQTKRRLIGEIADAVRQGLGMGVPVDVRSAVSDLGGTTQTIAFEEMPYEASVRKSDENSFEIRIRTGVSLQRERFSVAHELGHLFLHMGFQTDDSKWNNVPAGESSERARYGISESEYEANEFAAVFLMSEKEYRSVVNDFAENNQVDMTRVAKHFGVSLSAARLRGQWLDLISWD